MGSAPANGADTRHSRLITARDKVEQRPRIQLFNPTVIIDHRTLYKRGTSARPSTQSLNLKATL